MAAPKGHERYGGRTKGTPNKANASVKEALETAFESIGGIQFLAEWAKTQPGDFYKLWVKILPPTPPSEPPPLPTAGVPIELVTRILAVVGAAKPQPHTDGNPIASSECPVVPESGAAEPRVSE